MSVRSSTKIYLDDSKIFISLFWCPSYLCTLTQNYFFQCYWITKYNYFCYNLSITYTKCRQTSLPVNLYPYEENFHLSEMFKADFQLSAISHLVIQFSRVNPENIENGVHFLKLLLMRPVFKYSRTAYSCAAQEATSFALTPV